MTDAVSVPRISSNIRALMAEGQRHIPDATWWDYEWGGLDDELLGLLHPHLSECDECQRTRDAYDVGRPRELALLAQLPEFHGAQRGPTLEYGTKDEGMRHMLKFLTEANGEIAIVTGEGNPHVYGPGVEEVLRAKADEAVRSGHRRPRVICGPVMMILSADQTPILETLARDGVIELFKSDHRQAQHYRVAGSAAHVEMYHAAGSDAARHGVWFESASVASLLRRRFDAMIKSGLATRWSETNSFIPCPKALVRRMRVGCTRPTDYDRLTSAEIREQKARMAM